MVDVELGNGKLERTASIKLMKQFSSQVSCNLSFHKVSYVVPVKGVISKKAILANVSGIFSPGLNAIMGPSGSGKTTLLSLLGHKISLSYLKGYILLNGRIPPPNFKLNCGYVVQDDVVLGLLTVRENLMFSANLRLPKKMTQDEKIERVDFIIDELGLTNCADSLIGTPLKRGVSGGERKRCNVGMELLTMPQILFLDEPTTGLDASTSFTIINLLKSLSVKYNKTIIMSLHQPRYSIYSMFDKLHLLSLGKTVYHGHKTHVLEHFSSIGINCGRFENPSDFFLDVIAGNQPRVDEIDIEMSDSDEEEYRKLNLPQAFKRSEMYRSTRGDLKVIFADYKKSIKAHGESYVPALESSIKYVDNDKFNVKFQASMFKQIRYLVMRSLKNIYRNPLAFMSTVITAIFMSVIIGALYWQLNKSLANGFMNRYGLFLFLCQQIIFGSLPILQLFRAEQPLFLHERSNGYYTTTSYFLAKVSVDLVLFRSLQVLIFTLVIYFMAGLKLEAGCFFTFLLILFVLMVCASGMLLCVTISAPSPKLAQLFSILPTLFSTLFAGLIVNLKSLPGYISWLQYLSLARYALQAFTINEVYGMTFGNSSDNMNYTAYFDQMDIPDNHNYIWYNVIIMAGAAAFFYIGVYLQLFLLKKKK